jgi:AraC-like DNA-binding protein
MFNISWENLAVQAQYRPCQLAKLCNVSIRTLQRHFAKQSGMTLSGWLRDVRLNQAYSRIIAGEPIKAVAYDLGFKQLSHFSRVFKAVYGVAPRSVSTCQAGGWRELRPVVLERNGLLSGTEGRTPNSDVVDLSGIIK